MKNGNVFKGLGVAMVTPFNAQGQVDYSGLQRLTEHLIEGGVDYLVVHGTTGESPTLSKEEKRKVLDFILEVNNGRLPVVLGIGGNNTAAVKEEMESTDYNGVTGILSVSPAYNKPTQEGIYQHYKTIAAACPLPIILYNVPARTGSNVTAETTLRIANDIENIVAVKEASGNMEQVMDIINQAAEGFAVLSGDDALGLPIITGGGLGVISVIGNGFPKRYSDLVHNALDSKLEAAQEIHNSLLETIELIFAEGNPGGIKEILQCLGICDRHLRLPLVNVSETTRKAIYKNLAEGELVDPL